MSRKRFALPLILFLGSGALLLGALGFQYIGGLPPCPLCLWQRYPHDAVVVLAGLGMLVWRSTMLPWLLALCGLVLLGGAGIAAFHVGVEQGWWQGLAACAGQADMTGLNPDELRRMLNNPPARCDEVAWSLFGVSMAGYNFLISVALAVFAFWAAVRAFRGGRPPARTTRIGK